MNERSMMVPIGYLKRIACIFENRSNGEERIMLACMKERIWIAVLINVMMYRYENQVWRHVYKLREEFWSGYILNLVQMALIAILRIKPQLYGAQPKPKPKPSGSKPKPKPWRRVHRSRR